MLPIESFLHGEGVFVDVRAPCEFQHAHIPSAVNIALFSDEERSLIGTCYKRQGRREAISLGIKCVSPRLDTLLQELQIVLDTANTSSLKVYCARGGMRSEFVGWMLRFVGLSSSTLLGGYKAFRKYVLSAFDCTYSFRVVAGFTGSGKTEHVQKLAVEGEQVLDLEELANHRGSAFGWRGKQPSQEQFENKIAIQLTKFDPSRTIWVEDESKLIGTCVIPAAIFTQMRTAPREMLHVSLEERLQRILSLYGRLETNELLAAVQNIEKKLGREKSSEIQKHILENKLEDAAKMLLSYYDKMYAHSMQ